MANSFRVDDFKSNTTVSYATIGLFIAIAVVSALLVVASIVAIVSPEWALELDDGEGSIPVGLMFAGIAAILDLPLRVSLIVVFLIWLHRAYSNLSPLKATGLEFSPGWAVGWWFIPFANLVKPFQVVREIYNESDPEIDPDSGFLKVAGGTPLVIGMWWAAFLIMGFTSRIADRLYGPGDLPASESYAFMLFVSSVFSCAAALLAMDIVKTVHRRQLARYEVVASSTGNAAEPPPPPRFESSHSGESPLKPQPDQLA